MICGVKYETIYGERIKIFTPKQMLKILTIALAQVKASKNLVN